MAAANKTVPTKQSVASYLKTLSSEDRKIAKELVALFTEVTKKNAVLWGAMVGFGRYEYRYESGRTGESFATGFAMRKDTVTIYILPGYGDYTDILAKLGPHTHAKSCLYIKRKDFAAVSRPVLTKLIRAGLKDLAKRWPVV